MFSADSDSDSDCCCCYRWATLDSSELIYMDSLIGALVGGAEYDVAASASYGLLHTYSLLTSGNNLPQFIGDQKLQWSSQESWVTAGSVAASSQFKWANGINWNATGLFSYIDNEYSLAIYENDFDSINNEFIVTGTGGYGASSVNYW